MMRSGCLASPGDLEQARCCSPCRALSFPQPRSVEILVAFAVFYLVVTVVWRIAAGTLRAIGDILRMLSWPLLWLAHRAHRQALQAQRHRQRARIMEELRELAFPQGGGLRWPSVTTQSSHLPPRLTPGRLSLAGACPVVSLPALTVASPSARLALSQR